ncbi:MAG: MBL fold metallo-hydrolase [Halolamina sp.]
MDAGEYDAVVGCTDLYYHDTGMYGTSDYGSVYVVDADRPAVVDTGIGTNVETLVETIHDVGIDADELEYVLPTHAHLDHAGGAGFLAEAFPEATVLTHERGVDHLVDPERLVEGTKSAVGDQWEFYVDPEPVPEDRIEGLTDGDTVDLGDRTLEAVACPGHAPHQVAFHDDGDDALFTGDAAGIYVADRDAVKATTPPPQFDLDQARRDAAALAERDPDHLCFGHFGPRPFDAELLSRYQRTLVEWVEAVRRKRAELDDDDAVADHFAEHADLDDVWTARKAAEEERLNVRGVLAFLDCRAAEGAE